MEPLLFISYSRVDVFETNWMDRLKMYLAPYRRSIRPRPPCLVALSLWRNKKSFEAEEALLVSSLTMALLIERTLGI